MLDEQRIEGEPEPFGEPAAQPLLRLLRRIGADHPEPVRQAVHVRVDGDRRDPVGEDEDAVRRLRADAGEARQLLERPGDAPVEPVEEGPRARPHRPRLRAVESDRVDQHLDGAAARPRERRSVREPREQPGGGDVGLLVARPLGEDRPDQHLERVLGVVAEVRSPPVAGTVERGEAVEEEFPVEPGPAVGRHPRASRRAGAGGGTGAVSVPGSERSGSCAASRERMSSPTR